MISSLMMERVKITNRDSCKTYALKRIGLGSWIDCNSDKPTIKEIWLSEKFKTVDEPEVGSILIWKHKDGENGYFSPKEIDESGKIISTKEYSYAHLGVFEDGDMVSDCSLEEGVRVIRLRRYRDYLNQILF